MRKTFSECEKNEDYYRKSKGNEKKSTSVYFRLKVLSHTHTHSTYISIPIQLFYTYSIIYLVLPNKNYEVKRNLRMEKRNN